MAWSPCTCEKARGGWTAALKPACFALTHFVPKLAGRCPCHPGWAWRPAGAGARCGSVRLALSTYVLCLASCCGIQRSAKPVRQIGVSCMCSRCRQAGLASILHCRHAQLALTDEARCATIIRGLHTGNACTRQTQPIQHTCIEMAGTGFVVCIHTLNAQAAP